MDVCTHTLELVHTLAPWATTTYNHAGCFFCTRKSGSWNNPMPPGCFSLLLWALAGGLHHLYTSLYGNQRLVWLVSPWTQVPRFRLLVAQGLLFAAVDCAVQL